MSYLIQYALSRSSQPGRSGGERESTSAHC